MKKLSSALLMLILAFSLSAPVFAANQEIINLGDGYYAVVTTEVSQTAYTARASSVTASKSAKVYSGSTQVGTGTLTGTFSYTGSVSKAVSGSCSGSGMSGWTYKRGTATCSGKTVTGNFVYSSGSTTKTLTLTLTCSGDGTVS